MDGLRIRDAARSLAPLTPEDTLARAAVLLRSAPFDVLPVVEDGTLVGVLSRRTVADAVCAVGEGAASPGEIGRLPLHDGLVSPVRPLLAEGSLREAAGLPWGFDSLPVVEEDGRYVGMISRADVAGILCQAPRPPSIGGMATPLGVYLTTGTLSAGARGSLGLMLTGAVMASGFAFAAALATLLFLGIERVTGIPIQASMQSVPVSGLHLNLFDIWRHLQGALLGLAFALFLRLSPLTGYHAAEHQVVHAVERDRVLTPESVAQMPRAHPRCGTRLAAILVLLALFTPIPFSNPILPISDPTLMSVLAAVAILLWWRRLGMWLQDYVTTKPASQKQLHSAISAAETLLAQYHRVGPRRLTLWRRIWYMGILQVMAGGALVYALLARVLLLFGVPLSW